MRDCHSIVGLYTYQNRVPFAPSLRWVSCKERDRLPHEGANFHSSFVHYQNVSLLIIEGPRTLGSGRLTTVLTIPVEQWIGNAAAVLSGTWGAITRRSEQSGYSRTAIYTHAT